MLDEDFYEAFFFFFLITVHLVVGLWNNEHAATFLLMSWILLQLSVASLLFCVKVHQFTTVLR